jgi:hypothetical protein
VLRTAARDDDRVRHEVQAPVDEIAPDGWQPVKRAARSRYVSARGLARAEIIEEPWEGLFARTQKHGISMVRGFVGKRRDVQSTECDERAAGAVVIGQAVGAPCARDVDLNDDEIGPVIQVQGRNVFIFEHGLGVGRQVGGECREAERREQGVLDRTVVRTRGFGQSGQNEFGTERTHQPRKVPSGRRGSPLTLYCKVLYRVKSSGGVCRRGRLIGPALDAA